MSAFQQMGITQEYISLLRHPKIGFPIVYASFLFLILTYQYYL